jgi:Mu-like prophage protein gp29
MAETNYANPDGQLGENDLERSTPAGAQAPDDSRKPFTIEIATAWRKFFQPVFNGLLQPNDDTLATRGGGKGLRIYDELERDCNCYAMLQKRKMALIAREWSVEPGGNRRIDQAAADLVTAQLEQLQFDRICYDLLDAILKGYAVGEIIWDISREGIVAKDVIGRDQRRFVFAADYSLRLLTLEQPVYGIALPPRKFITHSFGAKDRNPYGLGLGTRLFWPVFFKRQGLQFWLTFLDKYGSPTALGTYPTSASPTTRQALLSALQAISQEAQIALPQGMDVKLLEASRSGNAGYKELLVYLDEEMPRRAWARR